MACNPGTSKGAGTPVVRYEGGPGSCEGPAGGTKTIGQPVFVPVVDNAPDLIWRDEDFTVIQADDDGTPWLFDNV